MSYRHFTNILVVALCTIRCGSETSQDNVEGPGYAASSEPASDPEPSSGPEPGQQVTAPGPSGPPAQRQLPLSIQAQLPDAFVETGAPPGTIRYFNVSVEVESGDFAMIGCVSSAPGSCRATWRHVFSPEQASEYDRRWAEVEGRPRCEPDAVHPGDRELTVSWDNHGETRHWPGNSTQMEDRNQGPCRALPRLVWWLVEISPARSDV